MKSFTLTSATGLTTSYIVLRNKVGVKTHTGEMSVMYIEQAREHYRETKRLYATCVPVSRASLSTLLNNLG